MTEKEWKMFFGLLEKVVNTDRPTVADKIATVKRAAVLVDSSEPGIEAEMNLEEFVSWDFERA
jgi:hypothetical protein